MLSSQATIENGVEQIQDKPAQEAAPKDEKNSVENINLGISCSKSNDGNLEANGDSFDQANFVAITIPPASKLHICPNIELFQNNAHNSEKDIELPSIKPKISRLYSCASLQRFNGKKKK